MFFCFFWTWCKVFPHFLLVLARCIVFFQGCPFLPVDLKKSLDAVLLVLRAFSPLFSSDLDPHVSLFSGEAC